MKTTFEEKIDQATSILDVLLILKEVTMLDTHVATLAYLEEIVYPFNGKYGIWACKPFPLDEGQAEYRLQAYFFTPEGNSFSKGSIALVTFCDYNFISGLQSPGPTPRETKDQILHSLKYGVISSMPSMEMSEEQKEELLDF